MVLALPTGPAGLQRMDDATMSMKKKYLAVLVSESRHPTTGGTWEYSQYLTDEYSRAYPDVLIRTSGSGDGSVAFFDSRDDALVAAVAHMAVFHDATRFIGLRVEEVEIDRRKGVDRRQS